MIKRGIVRIGMLLNLCIMTVTLASAQEGYDLSWWTVARCRVRVEGVFVLFEARLGEQTPVPWTAADTPSGAACGWTFGPFRTGQTGVFVSRSM